MAKNRHLTLEDRREIFLGLNKGASFKAIARAIGKDCTTISREVRAHFTVQRKGTYGRPFNDCRYKGACPVTRFCSDETCKRNACVSCRKLCCKSACEFYEPVICKSLQKPPYVCNACHKGEKCLLEKRLYNPLDAHDEYRDTLSASRQGFAIDEETAGELGAIIADAFSKGQSLNHVIMSYGEDAIGFSAKTLYTYVDAGVFEGLGNIDMPRKVRYAKRKTSKKQAVKKDKKCFMNRTYSDYLDFIRENPGLPVVEMDTVEGRKGIREKCLLTLHFTSSCLMLAVLLDSKTAANVNAAIQDLRNRLGNDMFARLFPVILTDRGSEFSDPNAIEKDQLTGEITTSVFYCDAMQSYQKGACEKNHEFIRAIIPKGTSMNRLSQKQISLMMSHINSYKREALNSKSPIELFAFLYGNDVLPLLELELVHPTLVTLKPYLIEDSLE